MEVQQLVRNRLTAARSAEFLLQARGRLAEKGEPSNILATYQYWYASVST